MLFNSFEFLLFLPIVFILYWFCFGEYGKKALMRICPKASSLCHAVSTQAALRWQNAFIIAASYLFYGWWDWRFLLLIAFTSLCSWASGILIGEPNADNLSPKEECCRERRSTPSLRKFYLWTNILLNLGILGFFKYFNFFVQSFVDLFATMGITLQATTLHIILPVGISFYTFQALSYSIDVYKGKIAPTRDILAFFAYVSFFPQLVAGPIERATNLLPQFQQPRHFDYAQAVDGFRQMLWGFFKKIVIADNCAVYVNQVFDSYQTQSGSTLLLAAVFFTFQIYGDFSGYSDIAIGCAKLFGIRLMRNFNVPYFSRDIAEFWRRWHISLTTWFRDYIYIPLGGSRTTKAKVVRNTFVIFLVSGLWHGANWTFVAWGAYHALLFLPLILLGKNRKYTNIVASEVVQSEKVGEKEMRCDNCSVEKKSSIVKLHLLPSWKEALQMLCTFILVVIGWIIFRAESLSQAIEYMAGIMNSSLFTVPWLMTRTFYIPLLTTISLLLIVEWLQRDKQHALELSSWRVYKRWILCLVLIWMIYAWGRFDYSEFIYFQF